MNKLFSASELPPEPTVPRSLLRGVDSLWHWLADPRLLFWLALGLAAPIWLGLALPQLPGQLRSEPAAAERWLTASAETFGVWGPLLRTLGLFEVLRSPLVSVALWTALWVLLVQLAHTTTAVLRWRRLHRLLEESSQASGEAVPVLLSGPLWRWRGVFPATAQRLADVGESQLQSWAARVERRVVCLSAGPDQMALLSPTAEPASLLEERLLGVQGWPENLLRPLLPAALLLALCVPLASATLGHAFQPPPLLPGERSSDTTAGLLLEYLLLYPQPGVVGPVLRLTKGSHERLLPLAPSSSTVEGVHVDVQPGPPALLVHTVDGSAQLARPGQPGSAETVSLGFSNPGSEQVLLLPGYELGLRIIRQNSGSSAVAENTFSVEIFQGDQAAQRLTIQGSQIERIDTPAGPVLLGFVPIAMLQVHVYTTPGTWLLLPALLLAVAGAAGFRRKPLFLLAQLAPWPVERSVVVLQSNSPALLAEVRQTLDPFEPPSALSATTPQRPG